MEKLEKFEQAKILTGESTQIPKGGYIVKIMDCKEVKGDGYSYLAFSFDIAEGEYKGHFADIYKSNTDENKKWKGIYNAFIPQKNSQYYEDNLIKFKTLIVNFEESNPGYHWDWDETKLKGKLIGVVYGEEEFKPDDKDVIIITKPRYFTGIDKIRDGKFKEPKLKKLKGSSALNTIQGFEVDDTDDDLPF